MEQLSYVRVWLKDDRYGADMVGRENQVGHLARVIERDAAKGMHVALHTTASSDWYWLPHEQHGSLWDWLQEIQIQVMYADDEEGTMKTPYLGRVTDCDLDKLLLSVLFMGEQSIDWVSLTEDEWKWVDGGRPSKLELGAALKRLRPPKQATYASKTPGPKPPPPEPPKPVNLRVDSPERALQIARAVRALTGASPERPARLLRQFSWLGVRELVMLLQLGAVKPLVDLLGHRSESVPQDAAVALINISLYQPARPTLQKAKVVESIGGAPGGLLLGDYVQVELGLALLQNLTLLPQSHAEVMSSSCCFLRQLRQFCPGQRGGPEIAHIRTNACAVVQHLAANSENVPGLLQALALEVMVAELHTSGSAGLHDRDVYALNVLINVSYNAPHERRLMMPALLQLLAALQQMHSTRPRSQIAELVTSLLHNLAFDNDHVPELRRFGLVDDEMVARFRAHANAGATYGWAPGKAPPKAPGAPKVVKQPSQGLLARVRQLSGSSSAAGGLSPSAMSPGTNRQYASNPNDGKALADVRRHQPRM